MYAKIRHISDYFADYGSKIVDGFTDILACYCSQKRKTASIFGFGGAISFLPFFSFTLMCVYMNTGDKVKSFFFWQVKRVFNVMM